MLRRIEVMEAELDAGGNVGTTQECAGFSLCFAKILQSLRNFRYAHFFAMITKFRYHSENSLS